MPTGRLRIAVVGKERGWTLSITIYRVNIYCIGADGEAHDIQDEYFFSFRRAERFVEKNKKELAGLHWSIGGEKLWLW